MSLNLWTLGQHSGYVRSGDGMFRRAVQVCAVKDEAQRALIEARGGLVMGSMEEANRREHAENYPAEKDTEARLMSADFLRPSCDGSFDEAVLVSDDLPLYLPAQLRPS